MLKESLIIVKQDAQSLACLTEASINLPAGEILSAIAVREGARRELKGLGETARYRTMDNMTSSGRRSNGASLEGGNVSLSVVDMM